MIAPQLEEWAEVATFDAPGVGDEPVPEGAPELIDRDVVVQKGAGRGRQAGLGFVLRRSGTHGVRRPRPWWLRRKPEPVRGLALGHATLHFDTEGARPAVNGEVVAAMTQLLRTDHNSFVRYGLTQFTQGGFDEEMAAEMVRRFPATEVVSRVWEMHVERAEPIGDLLRELDKPLLIAKHEGCLVFTAEGYEDLAAAFPDSQTVIVHKPSSASEEFAEALRRFCASVGG